MPRRSLGFRRVVGFSAECRGSVGQASGMAERRPTLRSWRQIRGEKEEKFGNPLNRWELL
ncbi:Hypothetical protein DEACI_0575 [Acididesulfobacillus acetoxydans]|uniref:Uncharacterized protein n=1 Tax=Acididesulfobacillus acetoxydans TaxID=1561005 RepID=A0A8S0XAJ4_9FIRM|nr:Hypothetical protein DEACI_0575 [Acididesulfobacillus acetoxydans]CEJ07972.1 Hypothetical protein DEACI_2447 [Acididesulfobacillus acetoxydans]